MLLAEDNQVNRLLAEAMLRSMGYEVDAAVNRAEAVAGCLKPYAFELMDCPMPEIDGYEAAARRAPLPTALVGALESCGI